MLCPFCQNPRCFIDRHHYYHPRRAYQTPLEKAFRGLFIEHMWRCQHEMIHRTRKPPKKPSRRTMQRVVEARKKVSTSA